MGDQEDKQGNIPVHAFIPERDMAQSDGKKRYEDQDQLDGSRLLVHDVDRRLELRSTSTSETSPRFEKEGG